LRELIPRTLQTTAAQGTAFDPIRYNITMLRFTALLALSAAIASAENLFVSSYAGNITSLSLTETGGNYSLVPTAYNPDCGPNPSWLTIDPNRGLLFCMNEGLTAPNGSLSSFTINRDGTLNHIKNQTTISGPVNGVIYGNPAGQRAIALAHYTGSALTTWYLNGGGQFSADQSFPFTLSQPGPVPDRQDAPHEHEVILDPTGQYLLVPDLGADLVRVYSIDATTLKLTEKAPLLAPSASGPRHGAFYNPYDIAGGSTYFYLVTELASTVIGYAVDYLPNNGGLNFTLQSTNNALGLLAHERINAPAGVVVSPDNRFLIVSNRNSSIFALPNPDPKNSTTIPSDSLTTFELQHDGSLVFLQAWPSGGLYPREFSLNPSGTIVAVGNQNSGNVALLRRDVASGLIGEPIARIPITGNVTCVVWDQEGQRSG
jgi:6-phosphogluconolactonase (cycloisomerase 2 family)